MFGIATLGWIKLLQLLDVETDKFNNVSLLTVAVVALSSTCTFLFMLYKNSQKANISLLMAQAEAIKESNKTHSAEIKGMNDAHAREVREMHDEHAKEIKQLNDNQLKRYEDIINENKQVLKEVKSKL